MRSHTKEIGSHRTFRKRILKSIINILREIGGDRLSLTCTSHKKPIRRCWKGKGCWNTQLCDVPRGRDRTDEQISKLGAWAEGAPRTWQKKGEKFENYSHPRRDV